MSDQNSNQNRLAKAAAEALVEAVKLDASSMTSKQLAANLDGLKESLKASIDNNHNAMIQTARSSNENFDAKMNTLTQHMVNMETEMGALKAKIGALEALAKEDAKDKRLNMALGLTHLASFDYYTETKAGDYHVENSQDLAKSTIELFLLGHGARLSGKLSQRSNANEKDFADKFAKQIKDLIKREPRLVKKDNGKYTIYYS